VLAFGMIFGWETSLKTRFWDLFDICNQPKCTLAQAWGGVRLKLTFRRCVDHRGMTLWQELVDLIQPINLTLAADVPCWMLDKNGIYSVKSFYQMLNFGDVVSPVNDSLWIKRNLL
jgi:hypothetical protein